MHAEIKNPTSMEVNPAIGSGFDASRGTFQGDQVTSPSPEVDHVNDHPFHNVDYNTMMAMKKALVVLQKVKGDNSVHQIADRLYLGSIGAALNVPELQSVGITHILCTATGVRSMHPDKFVYKTLTVLDSQSESLLDHFADSIYWIECVLRESSDNKILVHCFAGRSRSVAIILAYLMYKLRVPLSVALLHVRQFRANANPNNGFINQLKAFEYELFRSKKSFAFPSLLADLTSLIGPAKERLKNVGQWAGASASSTPPPIDPSLMNIPRSNSFAGVLNTAESDSRLFGRSKSSTPAVDSKPLGDSGIDNDDCTSPPRLPPYQQSKRIQSVRDYLFILLVAVFLVVLDHMSVSWICRIKPIPACAIKHSLSKLIVDTFRLLMKR